MKKINLYLLACVMAAVLLVPAMAATELPLDSTDTIESVKIVEHFLYEPYLGDNYNLQGVMGYHFDYYYNPNYYISWAVYGATNGVRGGYGIAAVGVGYRRELTPKLNWDSKFFLGSGGGKDIPANGGLAVEVLSGLSYRLTKSLFLDVKAGYLTFPTGTFQVAVWHMGISYEYDMLVLKR
jgi:hypothetical protein